MPEFIISTCPHCKGEFEKEILTIICGGVRYEQEKYKPNSDGIYSPYRAPMRHPQNLEKCPLCNELINKDDPENCQYKYRYEAESKLDFLKKENIKKFIQKFLP